jgi:hypothetical protein
MIAAAAGMNTTGVATAAAMTIDASQRMSAIRHLRNSLGY